MRALRERPRVATVRMLGILALVACGAGLGVLIASGGPEVPKATQVRLMAAERTAGSQARLLRTTRSELSRARIALATASRRSRATSRSTARLRRDLRKARRALRRERRRP